MYLIRTQGKSGLYQNIFDILAREYMLQDVAMEILVLVMSVYTLLLYHKENDHSIETDYLWEEISYRDKFTNTDASLKRHFLYLRNGSFPMKTTCMAKLTYAYSKEESEGECKCVSAAAARLMADKTNNNAVTAMEAFLFYVSLTYLCQQCFTVTLSSCCVGHMALN